MKIVDDYLEVTEPEIAVLFLREKVEVADDIGVTREAILRFLYGISKDIGIFGVTLSDEKLKDVIFRYGKIRIPKATVKKVCEAKEKEASFAYNSSMPGDESPRYHNSGFHVALHLESDITYFKASALTIGKTVGELRELVEWMEK